MVFFRSTRTATRTTTATTRWLWLLLGVTVAVQVVVVQAGSSASSSSSSSSSSPGYRLQASSYSLTLDTSYALKQENCRTNFGPDATLLDIRKTLTDFSNEDEFNEAMAAVFFKNPSAGFFVAYDDTDEPTTQDNSSKGGRYAIVTTKADANHPTVVQFGRARLIVTKDECQIICAVPVKEYHEKKPYVPSDGPTSGWSGSGNYGTTMFRLSLLALLVGVGLWVRRRQQQQNGAGFLSVPYFGNNSGHAGAAAAGATYNMGLRGGDHMDMATNLTQGCELSYSPVPPPGMV